MLNFLNQDQMEVNFTIDLFKDHPLQQTISDNTDVDSAAEPFKLLVFQVDMSSVKKANSANVSFHSLELTDESEVVDDCIPIPRYMMSPHVIITRIAPHRKSCHKPNKTRICSNSCYGKYAGQKPVERRIYQKYNKMILYPKS